MKFKIENQNTIIIGSDYPQVVASMRNGAFNPSDSIQQYMEECSERAKVIYGEGIIIRQDSEENFVQDLVKVGYLIPVLDSEKSTPNFPDIYIYPQEKSTPNFGENADIPPSQTHT